VLHRVRQRHHQLRRGVRVDAEAALQPRDGRLGAWLESEHDDIVLLGCL
jgi:hypothetical protein